MFWLRSVTVHIYLYKWFFFEKNPKPLWKHVFLLRICVKTEVDLLQHYRQTDDTYINNDYINVINSVSRYWIENSQQTENT